MNSKVLLINPPFNVAKDNYDSSVSVGLLSIATYLDFKGVPVKILDGVRQKDFWEIFKREAADSDLICFSVMTMQIPKALELSASAKKINPACKIIWGGAHPTFFPEQTAAHELIDAAVIGDGEYTILDLVKESDWQKVKGIAYKQDGQVKINQRQRPLEPDNMPLFRWELEPEEILKNLSLIPTLTSRGCPHRCTFCINAILKNNWRPRTVEQVLSDLLIIKDQPHFKNKKLRFWDENFFVDIKRAKAIVDGMIGRGLERPWETTVRANYISTAMVDDEFMDKLKRSGCYLLSFGAESGSQLVLDKIKKDITPAQIIYAAKQCLKHDIIPQFSFMVGLPGELKSDMKLTLKLIDSLIKLSDKVQILGPQAFRPYPGSELYNECVASGWSAPESLEEWNHLVKNQLNYLQVKNFNWVKHKDFVDSMEAYVRFGAHSVESAMGSSVSANKILKFGFILLCKLRWKLKFFAWPIEFKLAKKFVVK
ncbi:MAG: radical SAM protein [bacterium]|nr:radical SAM protein [bacterium]